MEEEIMLNKKSNKKKVILLSMLLLIVIVGTVGVAYATYRFQTEGDSSELITGDIYMHYKGQNAGISIDNAVSSKTYDPKEYFEFTIDGKNTYTEKDIWYEIDLVEGDQPEGRTTRIDDKYLRFTLTEKIESGPEKTVVNSVGYDDITNKKIWVNKIDRNTNNETTITYKLYMWISDEVHIGYDDEGEIEFDYSTDEWADNVYASVKVNVKGDFIKKDKDKAQYHGNLLEIIKRKAYTNEKEMIELDVTDKNNVTKCVSEETCADKEKIEYRYSGPEVNNYITLADNDGTEEMWRIIGIFEDDEVGEYIKISKEETFAPKNEKFPTYFKINGTQYVIGGKDSIAYWNRITGNLNTDKNNWATAGLQYYLNNENDEDGANGYLHYLSDDVKQNLVSVKHYLGTVNINYNGSSSVNDTPKQAYAHERDVESCVENKSTNSNKVGCYVWSGNDATWRGMVGLMYPSDYGLSADSNYWDAILSKTTSDVKSFEEKIVQQSSWMYLSYNKWWWLISPSSYRQSYATQWFTNIVNSQPITYESDSLENLPSNGMSFVLPVLYLSSKTILFSGDGTKENPYKIIAD